METAIWAGVVVCAIAAYYALVRWVLPRFGVQT
jgi:hypothetical protein